MGTPQKGSRRSVTTEAGHIHTRTPMHTCTVCTQPAALLDTRYWLKVGDIVMNNHKHVTVHSPVVFTSSEKVSVECREASGTCIVRPVIIRAPPSSGGEDQKLLQAVRGKPSGKL